MNKKYWLRGLTIGVVFGILVTYAHEHVYEFAHLFNINYDGVTAPQWFGLYLNFIQRLYEISFIPWFFLDVLIMFVQYFLPPVTYGILGSLIGLLYGKIKNRNKKNEQG